MTELCIKCGRALQQPSTGRERRFCSTACRRLAELARLRLQRELEKLEAARVSDEFTGGEDYADMHGRRRAERLGDTLRAIEAVEARFRALLEGDADA